MNAIPTFSTEQFAWASASQAKGRSRWSKFIKALARRRRFRSLALRLAIRTEGGRFFSETLREILREQFGAEVGAYSYGPCLEPGVIPPGSSVGRYCSIAEGLSIHRRNHPIERVTQHPFFYNAAVGLLERDTIETVRSNPVHIGHDVWIGDRVTIVSTCKKIGNGAVIGAGSVVTRDVEPYSIVVGMPAKPLRMRFEDGVIAELEASRWWELRLPELMGLREMLFEPMTVERAKVFREKARALRSDPGGDMRA